MAYKRSEEQTDSGLGMLGEKRTSNAKQSELFTSIFIVLSNYNQLQDGNVSGTAQLHRGNHAGDHYVTHIQRNTWDTCTWWTNDRTEIKRLLPYFSVCKWVFSLFFSKWMLWHLLPAVAEAAAAAPGALSRMCFSIYAIGLHRDWRKLKIKNVRFKIHNLCDVFYVKFMQISVGEIYRVKE